VIGHQVTLGGRDFTNAAPQVEDGVYIGAGAKILGGVRIGRGANVGANAVITKDVPAGATVVGANRLLPKRSSYALD
jgi:serine O-acetyltransferase